MKIVIAGANGGVAQSMGETLKQRGHQLASISRGSQPAWSADHLRTDLSRSEAVDNVKSWLKQSELVPELVIQCAGLLHNEKSGPEKTLMQVSESWLHENVSANLIAHVHLAQSMNYLVNSKQSLRWVSLSAMVGSISDNKLGGWYSYRMSKAALNMFIRNLHIEWTRKSPQSVVVALHPGTTDTSLSEPFQANIPDGKLYTPELTGRRLADVVQNLTPTQSGQLLHWDGSVIPF